MFVHFRSLETVNRLRDRFKIIVIEHRRRAFFTCTCETVQTHGGRNYFLTVNVTGRRKSAMSSLVLAGDFGLDNDIIIKQNWGGAKRDLRRWLLSSCLKTG